MAARRTHAAGGFPWRQMPGPLADDEDWTPLINLTAGAGSRCPAILVAGGAGWDTQVLPTVVHRAHALSTAVHILHRAGPGGRREPVELTPP